MIDDYTKQLADDGLALFRALYEDEDNWQSLEDCVRQTLEHIIHRVSRDMY